MTNYILTHFPAYRKEALREAANAGGELRGQPADNIIIAALPRPLTVGETIFTRHQFPVLAEGAYPPQKASAAEALLSAAKSLVKTPPARFCVQCRVVNGGETDFGAKDIEVRVGGHFDALGSTPVFSDHSIAENPDVDVISFLLCAGRFYAGYSKAADNLSANPDEYRVLSRDKGREISRAENKLKEALSRFGLTVRGGLALDIGAAPGGWTKVLADYGLTVYAVDPADLHPSLAKNPKIRHFKAKAEDVTLDETFDIATCDMNVDPQTTAAIMDNVAANLKSGTTAVVTLKMPFANVSRGIDESRAILERNYEILDIKNLTHNRREVTALLRRK